MSQAERRNSTIPSRRAVLAGIAAAPALAAPALALAGATALSLEASHPDAELIEVGRAFDDLRAKYGIASELSRPNQDAFDAAIAELSERSGNVYQEGDVELYLEVGRRIDREVPLPSPNTDDLTDMMDPYMRKIMALPARTAAGLAVKARVAEWACDTYWDEPDDNCDWNKLMARKLIEAVLATGGVS
jgi:hypothetical protein